MTTIMPWNGVIDDGCGVPRLETREQRERRYEVENLEDMATLLRSYQKDVARITKWARTYQTGEPEVDKQLRCWAGALSDADHDWMAGGALGIIERKIEEITS